MRNSRLLEMEKLINRNGTVSMTELCEHFQVSMNTARRDIAELQRRGDVEKVYGGVASVDNASRTLRSFEERQQISNAAKLSICECAAELVSDGDIIFVDSGTTMVHLVDYLGNTQDVTIVTNNLALVQQAIQYENLRIIVLTGEFRRKTNSLTGMDTVRTLRQFNVQKAFLAATGTTVNGVTNSSPQEYEIKRAAIECSRTKMLLLCREKFGHVGLMTYAKFNDFDCIVTDQPPANPYSDAIDQASVKLIVAGQK